MERLNRYGVSAWLSISLSAFAGAAQCLAAPVAFGQASRLYLYDQQGVQACSFIMSNGQHLLQDFVGHGCPAQRIYAWRVMGAKPGMELMFYANADCDDLHPAYFFVISGGASEVVDMPAGDRQPVEHDGSYQHDIAPHVQSYGPSDKGTVAGAVKCIFINGAGISDVSSLTGLEQRWRVLVDAPLPQASGRSL